MRDVRLQRLSLRNFKGISSLDFTAGGEDAAIYGDNATGKTTLVDAFMWLLFGKDSLNQAAFEIKPLSATGEPAHGIEHGVAAQLNVSGKVLTLRKVLSEKWTKKRGSATKEFTGNTTDYYVDGVPMPKRDFDNAVGTVCDENLFRLLTNPRYFNEVMHWQKRRELLLEICGNVTDAQVIESDPALSGIAISDRSMDDQRKVLTARRAEINKELDKIPVRIDECKQLIPPMRQEMASDLQLADLHNLLTVKQNELARIEAGGEVAEKTRALREVEAKLFDLTGAAKTQAQARQDEMHKRKAEIGTQLSHLQAKAYGLDARIKIVEDRLQVLRSEWVRIDSAAPAVKDTCPTCKQPLPVDQVEAATQEYNEQKARSLAAISTEGKAGNVELTDLCLQREQAMQESVELAAHIETLEREISAAAWQADSQATPEYQALAATQETLKQSIAELGTDTSGARTEVSAEIGRLRAEIEQQVSWREQAKAAEHASQRIDALKAEERTLAGEYERIEKELALLDQFTRTKVGMLEELINGRFEMVNWKLFEDQINGGVSETCRMTISGVPYESLNNAARIQGGCDIVRTLQDHFKISLPIWIDNRESVTMLPEMRCQVVSLVVSEPDKTLRIETKQAAQAA